MGQVSQNNMEQIESNDDFNCFNNPKYGVEPEEDYIGEIVEKIDKLREKVKDLWFHRDLVTQNNLLNFIRLSVEHIGFLLSKYHEQIEEKMEQERLEDAEAREDYEGMKEVYDSIRRAQMPPSI